jgi:hypothetical protein
MTQNIYSAQKMKIVMGVPKWWVNSHCANADCRKNFSFTDNIHHVRITLNDGSTVDKCLCDACYNMTQNGNSVKGD